MELLATMTKFVPALGGIRADGHLSKRAIKILFAKDYVQDGLVVHFDGIENAGIGMAHDSSASVWSSLTDATTPVQTGEISFGDDYAEFSSAARINTGILWRNDECTVEVMFAFDDFSANMCVLACTSMGGFSIQYENGSKFFAARDAVENAYKFIYGDWRANQFHRCVFSVGGGAMKSYTGAEVDETIAFSTVKAPNGGRLYIGAASSGAAQYFNGKIKFVRIYNRALTDAEIAHNYAIDRVRFKLED